MPAEDDSRAVFNETCALARHYSTTRWAMYTVYVTITLALMKVEIDAAQPVSQGAPPWWYRLGCFVLALVFIFSLRGLHRLVIFYQEKSYSHEGYAIAKPTDHSFWKIAAPTITIVPFTLAAIVWLYALLARCGSPIWGR